MKYPVLSEDQFRAIGKIAVSMSELEDCMRHLIAITINQKYPQFGMILTMRMGVGTMTDIFPTLARFSVSGDDRLDDCVKFNKKVADLNTKRNDYVHSLYSFDLLEQKGLRKKLKLDQKNIIYDEEPIEEISSQILFELAESIDEAIEEFPSLLLLLISVKRNT